MPRTPAKKTGNKRARKTQEAAVDDVDEPPPKMPKPSTPPPQTPPTSNSSNNTNKTPRKRTTIKNNTTRKTNPIPQSTQANLLANLVPPPLVQGAWQQIKQRTLPLQTRTLLQVGNTGDENGIASSNHDHDHSSLKSNATTAARCGILLFIVVLVLVGLLLTSWLHQHYQLYQLHHQVEQLEQRLAVVVVDSVTWNETTTTEQCRTELEQIINAYQAYQTEAEATLAQWKTKLVEQE